MEMTRKSLFDVYIVDAEDHVRTTIREVRAHDACHAEKRAGEIMMMRSQPNSQFWRVGNELSRFGKIFTQVKPKTACRGYTYLALHAVVNKVVDL
jgi:hypothetical protein